MIEKYIKIRDTEIYTIIKGEGFPLFLLHGGPGLDHHAFGDYFDDLANEYKLIFIDLRGHGKSKEVDLETLTTKQMAQDIVELAKELCIEEYGIIGHSFGTFVTLQHAVDFPGLAKLIVLIASVPSAQTIAEFTSTNTPKLPSDLLQVIMKAQEKMSKATNIEEFGEAIKDFMPFYFAYPTDYKLVQEFNEKTKDVILRPDITGYCGERGYGEYDIRKKLGDIKTPVLLLAGKQDNVCSYEAQVQMSKKIAQSKLVAFDCGHQIFAEENEKTMKIIRDFVGNYR